MAALRDAARFFLFFYAFMNKSANIIPVGLNPKKRLHDTLKIKSPAKEEGG
jgi:hypothetical protein